MKMQQACLPGVQPQINDIIIIDGWGSEVFEGTLFTELKQTSTEVINCND
jgi:hypothetical protein